MRAFGFGLLLVSVLVAKASAQDPARFSLEYGSATERVIGSAGGALGGALLASGTCLLYVNATQDKVDPDDSDEAYGIDISATAWIGLCYALISPFTIAAGATLAGDGLGGQGRYGVALAGAGIGLLSGIVATLIAGLATEDDDATEAAALLSLGALPMLGATIGYALDSAAQSRRAATLAPLASITDGGRGLSLGARLTF